MKLYELIEQLQEIAKQYPSYLEADVFAECKVEQEDSSMVIERERICEVERINNAGHYSITLTVD